MTEDDNKASLISHLEELRWRLVRCAIAVVIGFGVAYAFKERLFEVLTRPLIDAMAGTQNTMIFTGLPEAFFTYLKVSLLAGIILALPVIFYQFWMFVAPGLYKRERRIIMPVVLISLVFFATGAAFGYFLVFPYGFKFFLGFSSETVRAYPSMKEYLTFSSKLLLAFGLAFELPLIITCFARFGMVSVDFLKKNRKYAILIFFTGSALLTPPDVVTQVMLAVPLMILYELSIWGAKLFGRKPLTPTDDPENKTDNNTADGPAAEEADSGKTKND